MLLFSYDTIDDGVNKDTIIIYELKKSNLSLNLVRKVSTTFLFGNYTSGYYGNSSLLFSDNKFIYSDNFIDSLYGVYSLERNKDIYVLYPKIYIFYIRNDSIFGRVYNFTTGFLMEKLLATGTTPKKQIDVEFKRNAFLITYAELNSTWDISGIFVDTLLNVGIDESGKTGRSKVQIPSSMIIYGKKQKLNKYLIKNRVFSVLGRRSKKLKKGIYFIKNKNETFKVIFIE